MCLPFRRAEYHAASPTSAGDGITSRAVPQYLETPELKREVTGLTKKSNDSVSAEAFGV